MVKRTRSVKARDLDASGGLSFAEMQDYCDVGILEMEFGLPSIPSG